MEPTRVLLKECYEGVRRLFPSFEVDKFDIANEVSRLRETWKPETTKVVLLAESHANTSDKDFENRWHVPNADYHGNFVRFVYCLANGEKKLAPGVTRNVGTSQFMKIFFSCLNPVSSNRDFTPILHSTPFVKRIANKLVLLSKMKEAGIWLVDASIIAINNLEDTKTRKSILRYCWNHYTGPLIKSLGTGVKHIIVIGRQFPGEVLRNEIDSLGIKWTLVPQPQAHIPAPGYFPYYKTFYEICSAYRTLS